MYALKWSVRIRYDITVVFAGYERVIMMNRGFSLVGQKKSGSSARRCVDVSVLPTPKPSPVQKISLKEFAKKRLSRMDNYNKIEKIGEGTFSGCRNGFS